MIYINQKQAKILKNDKDRTLFVAQVALITLIISIIFLSLYTIITYPENQQSSFNYVTEMLHHTTWPTLLALASIGTLFYLLSVLRLFGQKQMASYLFLPLYRTSIIFTVVGSLYLFDEQITGITFIAFTTAFAVSSFFLVNKQGRRKNKYSKGIFIALTCALLSSATQLLSAFLLKAEKVDFNLSLNIGNDLNQIDPIVLVIGSNLINLIICLSIILLRYRETLRSLFHFHHASYSSGIYNFVAFFSLSAYLAESSGRLSVIYSISALSIVLPTLIMQLRGEEAKASKRQIIAYLASLCAILLLTTS